LSLLALARAEGAVLLTGDKALRAAGEEEGIQVRGVLWLMDMMAAANVLTGTEAVTALHLMLKSGSRLPEQDCERYIQKWRSSKRR
jgi:predicted nucleic acid-binding protein